jgi:hypothetical protein
MAAFLDICRFLPTAGGTTDWIYAAAVQGYQSPASAGILNSTNYKYFAISADSSQWEIGEGAYNTGTNVLARTTVLFNSSATGTGSGQSGAGTKINFSTVPTVSIVALNEDLVSKTYLTGGASLQTNPSDPGSATSSTTLVHMGFGGTCKLTPATTGRVMIAFNYGGSNASGTTAGGGYGIQYGTGTAPVLGAAVTGTQLGSRPVVTTAAGQTFPIAQGGLITGLTIGTQYWFDVVMLVNNASASIKAISAGFTGLEQ